MTEPLLYRLSRPIINLFIKIVFKPKYIGLENIPKDENFVLAGNHTNIFDPLLIISSNKRVVHFLAKDDLYKGIKGIIFKNMGIIPVNRKVHDKRALNSAEKALEDGHVIGIFPEGTINRTNDIIMPFKIGAVKMASDTSSYLVPFTIKGKYKIFGGNLRIEFFKAYKVSNDLTLENEKLMKIISNSLEKR